MQVRHVLALAAIAALIGLVPTATAAPSPRHDVAAAKKKAKRCTKKKRHGHVVKHCKKRHHATAPSAPALPGTPAQFTSFIAGKTFTTSDDDGYTLRKSTYTFCADRTIRLHLDNHHELLGAPPDISVDGIGTWAVTFAYRTPDGANAQAQVDPVYSALSPVPDDPIYINMTAGQTLVNALPAQVSSAGC